MISVLVRCLLGTLDLSGPIDNISWMHIYVEWYFYNCFCHIQLHASAPPHISTSYNSAHLKNISEFLKSSQQPVRR